MSSFILELVSEAYFGRRMIDAAQSLSSELDTLSLSFLPNVELRAERLLVLTFPRLRCLTLGSGFNIRSLEKAMDFWTRHPNLESLDIAKQSSYRWFVDGIAQDLGLLPNLKHLKVLRDFHSSCGQLLICLS